MGTARELPYCYFGYLCREIVGRERVLVRVDEKGLDFLILGLCDANAPLEATVDAAVRDFVGGSALLSVTGIR